MVEELVKHAHEKGHYSNVLDNYIDNINSVMGSKDSDKIFKAVTNYLVGKSEARRAIKRLVNPLHIQTYHGILSKMSKALYGLTERQDHPLANKVKLAAEYWDNSMRKNSNPINIRKRLSLLYSSLFDKIHDEQYFKAMDVLNKVDCEYHRAVIAHNALELLDEIGSLGSYFDKLSSLQNMGFDKLLNTEDPDEHKAENLIYLVKEIVAKGNNVPLENILAIFWDQIEDAKKQYAIKEAKNDRDQKDIGLL